MVSVITSWTVRWKGLSHSWKRPRLSLIRRSLSVHRSIGLPTLWSTIILYTSQQSLKSRAIKGKKWGVAVGGCRSSVTERWRLKPEALGLIPGSATFLSFPLPFQRSTNSNDPDCLWLDDRYRSSDCGGVPSIGFPTLWLRSPSIMINNCT